jgi:hypothetical protein
MINGTFFYRKKAGRKALLCCSPMRPGFQTSKNALETLKTLRFHLKLHKLFEKSLTKTFARNYVSLILLLFLIELTLFYLNFIGLFSASLYVSGV